MFSKNCRCRGLASGLACSFSYSLAFITKKTYYNLETSLSLPGVALFYSAVCGTGLIIAYFIFPVTENRSLEDIELHFSDNSKKITDIKIAKSTNGGRGDATDISTNQRLLEEKCWNVDVDGWVIWPVNCQWPLANQSSFFVRENCVLKLYLCFFPHFSLNGIVMWNKIYKISLNKGPFDNLWWKIRNFIAFVSIF